MATSRTGTTQWLKVRARVIRTKPHICFWCHDTLDPKAKPDEPGAIQVDHLRPYSLHPELQYDMDNLVLSCRPCNRAKSNGLRPGVPTGRADIYGIRVIDPRVRCRIHDPILASCPHSGSLR